MKIIYKSFDGKYFEDKDECLQHEQVQVLSKQDTDTFLNMVEQVIKYCANNDNCEGCPFLKENSCDFDKITNCCPCDW